MQIYVRQKKPNSPDLVLEVVKDGAAIFQVFTIHYALRVTWH